MGRLYLNPKLSVRDPDCIGCLQSRIFWERFGQGEVKCVRHIDYMYVCVVVQDRPLGIQPIMQNVDAATTVVLREIEHQVAQLKGMMQQSNKVKDVKRFRLSCSKTCLHVLEQGIDVRAIDSESRDACIDVAVEEFQDLLRAVTVNNGDWDVRCITYPCGLRKSSAIFLAGLFAHMLGTHTIIVLEPTSALCADIQKNTLAAAFGTTYGLTVAQYKGQSSVTDASEGADVIIQCAESGIPTTTKTPLILFIDEMDTVYAESGFRSSVFRYTTWLKQRVPALRVVAMGGALRAELLTPLVRGLVYSPYTVVRATN